MLRIHIAAGFNGKCAEDYEVSAGVIVVGCGGGGGGGGGEGMGR